MEKKKITPSKTDGIYVRHALTPPPPPNGLWFWWIWVTAFFCFSHNKGGEGELHYNSNSLSVNFRKMFPARKSGRGGGDMMLRSCCTTDGNSSHHDVDLQTVKRLTRFKYPLWTCKIQLIYTLYYAWVSSL